MFTSAPKFALVLMLTTLVLFLFPAASGSFTATPGPTTALRAATRFRALLASIAAWIVLMSGRVLVSERAKTNSEPVAGLVAFSMLSLRC
jgi:hypothetical protein